MLIFTDKKTQTVFQNEIALTVNNRCKETLDRFIQSTIDRHYVLSVENHSIKEIGEREYATEFYFICFSVQYNDDCIGSIDYTDIINYLNHNTSGNGGVRSLNSFLFNGGLIKSSSGWSTHT